MSEYSTNSDSETPSEMWNGVEQMSPIGQEYTGYQYQTPFYPYKETADIHGAPHHIGFDPSKNSTPPSKRTRTAYSLYQKSALEELFKAKTYVSSYDRSRIAAELGLSQKQVKIWFQNRRMKLKHKDAKSLSHQQVEGPRARAVNVENTEIVNRLLRHSVVIDPTRNTDHRVTASVMNVENAIAHPHQVSNESTPQYGQGVGGPENYHNIVKEHFLSQNSKVLRQYNSVGLRQEGLMQEGGSYNQFNNIHQQYLQPFYFPDPNMHVPRPQQDELRDVGFCQNNNDSFIPAASVSQVLPQIPGQVVYPDIFSTSHMAEFVSRII